MPVGHCAWTSWDTNKQHEGKCPPQDNGCGRKRAINEVYYLSDAKECLQKY